MTCIVMAAVLCTSVGLMLRYLGQVPTMPSQTGVARALIECTEYDFGEVKPGRELRHQFSLRNAGTRRLVINLADCGCGEDSADHMVLLPGEQMQIPVTMTVHHRLQQQHQSLVVTTSDPENPLIELVIYAKATI